jgi:DNA-binding Xre family transcriptional regulator
VGNTKAKQTISTFEREMKSPTFRATFEREEALLEVSEFIARQMTEQDLSVRKLASLASVSPTIIQGIRAGTRKNIEYATLKAILEALGCEISFKKARRAPVV